MSFTYAQFYYGFLIDEDCCQIDFQVAGETYEVQLAYGTYTLKGLVNEALKAMNSIGATAFTAEIDRATRKVNIIGADPFNLLGESGAGFYLSALPVLGFNQVDYEGANSYRSENSIGEVYRVQCPLQSFVPPENNFKKVGATTKRTFSGVTESRSWGTERFMECEFKYITDRAQPTGSVIRNNPIGLERAIQFFEYATTKAEIEFMADDKDPDTYQVFILESVENDQNGMGMKFLEEFDSRMPGYYSSGLTVWLERKVE